DRLGGGDERVGRGDDFVTGFHPAGQQGQVQRRGAGRDPDRMLRAAVGGKGALEVFHLASQDECRALQHPVHRRVDLRLECGVLRLQVDEGNHHASLSLVAARRYAAMSSTARTIRAGLPTTTAPGGTSLTTTAPAPTRAPAPMRNPGSTVTLAPTMAADSIFGPRIASLACGDHG